jgi:NAD(P)H-hydrate epimerase
MNGRLLIVGGSPGMSGAVRLAAEAGLRGGAGLVYVATHPDSALPVMAGRPELICRGVLAPAEIADWLESCDAIVVGPGLGQSDWARQLLAAILKADRPIVVDADGLNLLPQCQQQRGNWVLTPHPAEAGRLLGTSAAAVQQDRLSALHQLCNDFDAAVVLKGACSLVGQGIEKNEYSIAVCDHGNAGMASPGMGDLLAGLIGALLAQGGTALNASRIGVLVHALAGDAAAEGGERGLLASDLLPHIRRLVNL